MSGDGERAVVTYEAPQGLEVRVLRDGESVDFGRAASCGIRFAFAPVADVGVGRVAGTFVVANGRVFVQSAAGGERRAMELRCVGQPPVQLANGDGHSPRHDEFEVVVHGESTWRLQVATRPVDVDAHHGEEDLPTAGLQLVLTPNQRRVLDAYAAPVLRGRLEPATHAEVAEALGVHKNTAREVIYEVYRRMFQVGLPLPDVSDRTVAVVEAARVHGLVGAR